MKIEAVIDDVIIEPQKIQPIIVNFQNGQLKDTEAKKMKSEVFFDEKKKKTLVAMSNGQVVYRGYRPDAKKELTYTMFAIHNKKTGKIRLIQAERWDVAPVLDKEPEKTDDIDGDRLTMLNKQFGSKKTKRRTEQMERMKINVDTVKEQLEQTVSNVEIDRHDLQTTVTDETAVDLPSCNRDASIVEDVYNVHDIIPNDFLNTLETKVDEILAIERTSKYYVKTLNAIQDSPQRERKIAILEYINSIANWLNSPIKNAKKCVKEICPVSEEISHYIVENYSMNSASGRLRPTSVRDKAIIHCIILSLIISNFKTDLELLCTMLTGRIGIKKLCELARVIGACSSKDDKRIVILKVPLPSSSNLIPRVKSKKMKLHV